MRYNKTNFEGNWKIEEKHFKDSDIRKFILLMEIPQFINGIFVKTDIYKTQLRKHLCIQALHYGLNQSMVKELTLNFDN